MSKSITIARSHLYITRMGLVFIAVTIVSLILYATFLFLSVEHAAARTALQNQDDTLAAQVGDLETQYLADAQSLTPETAAQLGLVAPTNISRVYTTVASRTLSLPTTL